MCNFLGPLFHCRKVVLVVLVSTLWTKVSGGGPVIFPTDCPINTIQWGDSCYREHTQGPCPSGYVIQAVSGRPWCNPSNTSSRPAIRNSSPSIEDLIQDVDGGLCGANKTLLYPGDGKCYELFNEGPCGPSEWIVLGRDASTRSGYGVQCRVKPSRSIGCLANQYLYVNAFGQAECECESPHFYYQETGECYDLYTRGPCPPKQYLIYIPGRKRVVCRHNSCPDGQMFWPVDGQCHAFNYLHAAPCQPRDLVLDLQGELLCSIVDRREFIRTNCRPGTYRDYLGACARAITFDRPWLSMLGTLFS